MLYIAEEYKTPTETNYYHNHENFNNSDERNTTHKMTDFTKQELEENLSTNNMYQKTTNKVQPPKKQNWTLQTESKKQSFLVARP